MKKNIKRYRYLANVFINHIEAYENGKISLDTLIYSLYTKWHYSDNIYKNIAVIREITRLLGGYKMNIYQYELWLAVENKSNYLIQEHINFLTIANKPVY